MSGISIKSTHVTLLDAARAITAETSDAALVKVDGIANLRADQAGMVKAFTIAYAVRSGRATKVLADLLGVGGTAVRNHVKGVEAWEATGFTDDAIALVDGKRVSAWTHVTSSARWLNKWTTPEGEALMAAISAAKGDAAKFAILTSGEVPTPESKSREDKFLALLASAADLIGSEQGLDLDDEQTVIARDLLASIGALLPVKVLATV